MTVRPRRFSSDRRMLVLLEEKVARRVANRRLRPDDRAASGSSPRRQDELPRPRHPAVARSVVVDAVDVVRRMTTYTEGNPPQTIDLEVNPFMRSMMNAMIGTLNIVAPTSAEGLPRERVTVPAGTFEGA